MDICFLWIYNPPINHTKECDCKCPIYSTHWVVSFYSNIGSNLVTISATENCHRIFTILTISLIIIIEHLFGTLPSNALGGSFNGNQRS